MKGALQLYDICVTAEMTPKKKAGDLSPASGMDQPFSKFIATRMFFLGCRLRSNDLRLLANRILGHANVHFPAPRSVL